MIAASVRAEESGAGAQLSVVEPDSCISESRVRDRVQQYRGGAEVASELRVRVEQREGALGFVVLQGGEAVARRRLTQLSAACDERLDTLALAIAVALSNAAKDTIENVSGASPSLAANSSSAATPPAQHGTHSRGVQTPVSRQPSTTLRAARDATGAESVDARTARGVADEGRAASAAQPNTTRDSGRAELQPRVPSLHTRETDPATTQTRSTSAAAGQPRAASLEAREAYASTAAVVAQTHAAGVVSPPLAATVPDDRPAASRELESREAPRVRGAELPVAPAGESRETRSWAVPRVDGAAPLGSAVTAATARKDAPDAVRDEDDDDESVLARGSRAGDVGVRAGARYGLELLPDPLLLFDVGIEVGLSRVASFEAGGLVSPVKESAADGGRMRAQVTGGELLLCARPTAANVMLRWCAGVAAASVSVRGEAFFVDRSARLAWAAGLMRAAVRWPADSPLAVELALGGHANLVRPRMRVLHSGEPDRVSWILGGSLGLQLVVSLR